MTAVMYRLTKGKTLDGLVNAVETQLNHKEGMESQRLYDTEGNTILQARAKAGNWKMLIGMDKALTVTFSQTNDDVKTRIGNAKWADKGVAMAVSIFVL